MVVQRGALEGFLSLEDCAFDGGFLVGGLCRPYSTLLDDQRPARSLPNPRYQCCVPCQVCEAWVLL